MLKGNKYEVGVFLSSGVNSRRLYDVGVFSSSGVIQRRQHEVRVFPSSCEVEVLCILKRCTWSNIWPTPVQGSQSQVAP